LPQKGMSHVPTGGHLEESGDGVVWVVQAASLLRTEENAKHKIRSPQITVRTWTSTGPTELRASSYAFVDEKGLVSWFVNFPSRTHLRWAQWAGPTRPKTRLATDKWDREGQYVGKRAFWACDDHAEGGVLRLGMEVMLAGLPHGPSPMPDSLRLGEVVGSGSFGSVMAVSHYPRSAVAKLSTRAANLDFTTEAMVMRKMESVVGFPECFGHYRTSDHREVLLIERLHRDLESLRKDPQVGLRTHLGSSTVLEVGLQVIERLRQLHLRGLVHRDMKPDNLMIGSETGEVVFLVDFGLVRAYWVGGKHVDYKQDGLAGTARYCSMHVHNGNHSRRSDLEALAYVLIYLASGSLPWQGVTAATKEARYNAILKTKRDWDGITRHVKEKVRGSIGDALLDMLKYCRDLRFQEEPDYNYLTTVLEVATPLPALHRVDTGSLSNPPERKRALDWTRKGGGLTRAASDLAASLIQQGCQVTAAATRHRDTSRGTAGSAHDHLLSRIPVRSRTHSGRWRRFLCFWPCLA